MKISLNWIKEFTDIEMKTADLVDKIGRQLGAVDDVTDLGKLYEDAVVVKVISCEKHPDADKLSICLVADGGKVGNVERSSDKLVQIVCGAPNVKAGMLAVWLPPGSVVPSTAGKDPLTLDAREIRGLKSNGMLASAKELNIGDSHEGLLEIDEPAAPGDSFAKLYKLDDIIIDIENKMFTHRPDLFGHLGVAREISGISGQKFTSPEWYLKPDQGVMNTDNDELAEFGIDNQIPAEVPRFMAAAMTNLKVGPSPLWLQTSLSRLGLRPINNVVDVTNYLMLLTGQPTHAYDFDKLKNLSGGKAKIVVRRGQAGEKLKLLNGKEIALDDDDMVIATPERAIGLGGVMGGAETEVDGDSVNIVLECATFDMNATRRTSMKYGLFTDAVTRFTKGQSPLQNPAVLACGVKMLRELGGAQLSGAPWDNKQQDIGLPKAVTVNDSFINSRLGLNLDGDLQSQLMENVEIRVKRDGGSLLVQPPFWRTDLELPEDIVEEVGRLYGYEKMPLVLPKRDLTPSQVDPRVVFKAEIRELMTAAGGAEVLTYSFVNKRLLEEAGQDVSKAYHIKNALSPHVQYYRLNLLPSLLEKVRPNKKSGLEKFMLFEMGKGHNKDMLDEQGLPEEIDSLAAVSLDPGYRGAPYFVARATLDYVLQKLRINDVYYQPVGQNLGKAGPWLNNFELSRAATVHSGERIIGFVGEPSARLRSSLKLQDKVSMFEVFLPMLKECRAQQTYHQLNRFPSSAQDICLRLSRDFQFGKIDAFVWQNLHDIAQAAGYHYEMDVIDIFRKDSDDQQWQVTWHIKLTHPDKTLTTEEVSVVLDKIADVAKNKFNAERI